MQPFNYAKTRSPEVAIATVTRDPTISFIAGGTDLLALMKGGIRTPKQLLDINGLDLVGVETTDIGVRIGALSRMSDVARHPIILDRYGVLSQALLASASPQLRNMATIGGNLLQKVRCSYFRERDFACNRRSPGSGCSAIEGYNRAHAILGTSDRCIATHPSDMAVALAALDAFICTQSSQQKRRISIEDFYFLPGETPEKENELERDELISAIEIPNSTSGMKSHYLKVRDRASYEFALVSVAVALEINCKAIVSARIALGGVAPKPWRSYEAEAVLQGKQIDLQTFALAAETALRAAKPQKHNEFKIELAKRAIVRTLSIVGGIT